MTGARDLSFDSRLPSPYYSESHHAWRDTLRRFVDAELAPHVDAWEAAETIERDVHVKCAEVGLTGLGYPEQYGGTSDGVDPFHLLIRAEELGRLGAGGVTTNLMTHSIGLPPVLAFGSEDLKARIAPGVISGHKISALAITEPSGGSDVAAVKTRAVRDGDHYRVNGSKTLISGGMQADYYTVAVRTGADGASGVSLLLIEKGIPGFTQTKLDKQGWWASDTATLYFDDVLVPVANRIGDEGQGFRAIMHNFNAERLGMVGGANAAARVCLEEAATWAKDRHTFGKRLADHQVIRHKLAEMFRKISATQAYLEQCTFDVANGGTPVADLAMLKVQATQTMEFCAREASQILGGASYIRGSKVERIYREVRVNAIGGGSEEIMRDLAARQLGI